MKPKAGVVRGEKHSPSGVKSTRRPEEGTLVVQDDGRQRRTTFVGAGRRSSVPDDADRSGLVSLVGAGPGDPELLTRRAARRLAQADLVLYDGLVGSEVLNLAAGADCVSVSRRPGAKTVDQATVNQMMIEAARAGRRVVRLKAGDPFVLGRGGEEALVLAEAAIPFEIVPGVSAAVAGPAVAGIPVTHRGITSGFLVVSGHAPEAYAPILGSVAPASLTIVVLMGFAERAAIARVLMDRGWAPATPAAIVTNATQPARQSIWTGPLCSLGDAVGTASAEDAHAIVVGEVVSIGDVIAQGLMRGRGVDSACNSEFRTLNPELQSS